MPEHRSPPNSFHSWPLIGIQAANSNTWASLRSTCAQTQHACTYAQLAWTWSASPMLQRVPVAKKAVGLSLLVQIPSMGKFEEKNVSVESGFFKSTKSFMRCNAEAVTHIHLAAEPSCRVKSSVGRLCPLQQELTPAPTQGRLQKGVASGMHICYCTFHHTCYYIESPYCTNFRKESGAMDCPHKLYKMDMNPLRCSCPGAILAYHLGIDIFQRTS